MGCLTFPRWFTAAFVAPPATFPAVGRLWAVVRAVGRPAAPAALVPAAELLPEPEAAAAAAAAAVFVLAVMLAEPGIWE